MIHQELSFLDWLNNHLFACPFISYFGFDCPGCGFQRSIVSLLKGDLASSFRFYPAAIPLLFVIVFTLIHLKVDFKFGAKLIQIAFVGVAAIVLINYIYKIYNHQLIS